jgi:outer membrane biosynthesis protein TonB
MRTPRRAALGGLSLALLGLAGVLAFAGPGPVDAAGLPWTVSLAPTILTEGTATNVRVSVTPGGQQIGFVVVNVPAGFDVLSASVTTVPAGFTWHASGAGTGPIQVTFGTTQSNQRLVHTTGVFTIRVMATTSPLAAWTVKAYQQFSIDPNKVATGPLLPPAPFVIVPGATPTPTPTPVPTPTPTPTAAPPTPTPTPVPTATLAPTPRPSASPPPSPSAGTSTPAPTPRPTGSLPVASEQPSPGDSAGPSPQPSAEPSGPASPGASRSPGSVGGLTGGTGGGSLGGGGGGLDVQPLPAGGSVNLDDLGALGSTAMVAWLVPGLFLSLPALLIVIVVLIQAGFATAFIPLTRRFLAGERRHDGRAQAGRRPG